MNKCKLSLIVIACMLLTSCVPTVNKNIEFESFVVSGDNNMDYPCLNIFYNDIKYVEPLFSGQYYRFLTESDIVLYKRINVPMAGTTHVYTKEIDNPDYLFLTNSDYIGTNSYGIYFREDIDLKDEWFIYKNIEIKLYNEFIPVDEELNVFLNSLSFEADEKEFVNLYDGKNIINFEMKKYPEISYLADGLFFYDGMYYERNNGYHYKISNEFIDLCKENGFVFK